MVVNIRQQRTMISERQGGNEVSSVSSQAYYHNSYSSFIQEGGV